MHTTWHWWTLSVRSIPREPCRWCQRQPRARLLTKETLAQVLTRLNKGTAPGRSGWTFEHLLATVRGDPSSQPCMHFCQQSCRARSPTLANCMTHAC
jgi:hypothetical protein